jgi:hypothetical protein
MEIIMKDALLAAVLFADAIWITVYLKSTSVLIYGTYGLFAPIKLLLLLPKF